MQIPPPAPLRFEPCPATGEGVHFWLLAQANRCRLGGLSAATAEAVVRDAVQGCGRRVPDRELQAAVQKAYAAPAAPSTPKQAGSCSVSRSTKTWPDIEQDQVAKAAATGRGLADLWEDSEYRLQDDRPLTEEIIDALFPGDPLICVAKAVPADSRTAPRSAWRGQLTSCALIVPSPMSALTGLAKDGHESPRCLANTGPRRFLVVEFDHGDIDTQAALLLHLGQFAPLIVAVHSGSKSLHGWFAVANLPEAKVHRFFRYAVSLGADHATWTPCQLVRLPDGLRDNGPRQTVFFFSPSLAHA